MLKGAQKQLIVLRTGSSRYFDEAYFIVRKELRPGRAERRDLLAEANRILRDSLAQREPPRRRRWRPIAGAFLLMLLGALLGVGVTVLILG